MFVITADQIDSRSRADAADAALARIAEVLGDDLALPAERTAGDEIQAATEHAEAAYRLALLLTRDGRWSVGLGVGDVRRPLAATTRASTGGAYFAARAAIEAAKRAPTHFALRADGGSDGGSGSGGGSGGSGSSGSGSGSVGAAADGTDGGPGIRAVDVEALVAVVLALREKRTEKGWEVHDLLEAGETQSEAARSLGISQGAVSMRARTGSSREEFAASEAVVRLLAMLHDAAVRG